jgi:hypothetical protein
VGWANVVVRMEVVWVWTGFFDFSLSFLAFFVDLAKARLQHTPSDVSMTMKASFLQRAVSW